MTFRPIDLFVCIAVAIALLIGTLGVRRAAQDDSVIIGCAARLGQIAQSLVLYESLNDGQFPRTRADPTRPLTAYTGPDAADPFSESGPAANDVTAGMFLLARVMELPPEAFICPSALRHGLAEEDVFDRRTVKARSNFRSRLNSNYALANMYPDAAATAAGYSLDHFRDRLPETFAIAADTSPGTADATSATTQMSRTNLRIANSPNHERDGQNVLFADGTVRFYNSPFVGVGYDNVYTRRPSTPTASQPATASAASTADRQPAGASDSVLLPTWSDGPQQLPRLVVDRRWTLAGAVVVTFGAMFWVVRNGLKNKAMR